MEPHDVCSLRQTIFSQRGDITERVKMAEAALHAEVTFFSKTLAEKDTILNSATAVINNSLIMSKLPLLMATGLSIIAQGVDNAQLKQEINLESDRIQELFGRVTFQYPHLLPNEQNRQDLHQQKNNLRQEILRLETDKERTDAFLQDMHVILLGLTRTDPQAAPLMNAWYGQAQRASSKINTCYGAFCRVCECAVSVVKGNGTAGVLSYIPREFMKRQAPTEPDIVEAYLCHDCAQWTNLELDEAVIDDQQEG